MHLLRFLQSILEVWGCCLAAPAFTVNSSSQLRSVKGSHPMMALFCTFWSAFWIKLCLSVSIDDAHGIYCLCRRSDTKLKTYSRPIMLLLSQHLTQIDLQSTNCGLPSEPHSLHHSHQDVNSPQTSVCIHKNIAASAKILKTSETVLLHVLSSSDGAVLTQIMK